MRNRHDHGPLGGWPGCYGVVPVGRCPPAVCRGIPRGEGVLVGQDVWRYIGVIAAGMDTCSGTAMMQDSVITVRAVTPLGSNDRGWGRR